MTNQGSVQGKQMASMQDLLLQCLENSVPSEELFRELASETLKFHPQNVDTLAAIEMEVFESLDASVALLGHSVTKDTQQQMLSFALSRGMVLHAETIVRTLLQRSLSAPEISALGMNWTGESKTPHASFAKMVELIGELPDGWFNKKNLYTRLLTMDNFGIYC